MKKKILIADSDFANIKKLGKYFSENSFIVLITITTEQTVKIAKEKMPDIILSAFITPVIDGVEIYNALKNKKQTAHIPILFLSENKNKKLVELNCSKGGADYFLKPYSVKELLNKVIQLTDKVNNCLEKSSSKINYRTIMVVDDIEVNRNLIEDFLTNRSLKIVKSPSGKDSLKKIKENKIDLILLDIEMPIMNGWKTIEEYKKINPKIPVLAMSAHGDSEFETKCHQWGFHGIISKPINRTKLNNSLKKIFELPSVKNEKQKKQISVDTNEEKSVDLIDISKLIKVSENDIDLRINTYKKFSKNLNKLDKLFKDKNCSVSTNETFRRELHTFINLANYFCTSKILKKAKKMELNLKNNLTYFNQNKSNFTSLLKNIKHQIKEVDFTK